MYNRGGTIEHDSPRRGISGIPRSTTGSRDTSREASPTRGHSLSRFRRNSDRPPLSPATRPVMAQKILQQSREAESALADALVCSIVTIDRETIFNCCVFGFFFVWILVRSSR